MKNLFKLMLAAFALIGAVSCEIIGGDDNGGGNNGGGSTSSTSFVINVSGITTTGATVSVVPLISSTYYYDVVEKSVVDSFNSLTSFAAAYIDEVKDYAAQYGLSFADLLSEGRESYTFEGSLKPNTAYYAVAFGVTSNGELTTNVKLEGFNTLSDGSDNGGNNGGNSGSISQNTFSISVSGITSTSATVGITPSNSDTYYFDLLEAEVVESFTDLKEMAAECVAYVKDAYESYGYTLADALSSGSDGYTYDNKLDPGTAYYAFAFGVDANGTITTDVTLKRFATAASSSTGGSTSQNTFNVSVSNVTSDSATVSVTPSNNDTYYYDVYEADVVNQYGDLKAFATDYIAYVKEIYESYGYTFADALSSGSDGYTYDGQLDPNTTYYAFAFGVDANCNITTNVAYQTFTTAASGSTGGGTTTGGLNITNLVEGGCTNYGDYYGVGANNYWIDLYTADYSEILVFDLLTPLTANSCAGTYSFDMSGAAGTAISGFVDDNNIYGSFWGQLSETGGLTSYVLIDSGTLTISKSGSNYVITLNAKTDDGATITASYNGVLEEGVASATMSTGSKRKSFRITSVNSFKKLGGKNFMFKPISKKFAERIGVAPVKLALKKEVKAKAPVKITVNKQIKK